MASDPTNYRHTAHELGHDFIAGHSARRIGRFTVPKDAETKTPEVPLDSHGMAKLFAKTLDANLSEMHPKQAIDQALATVKNHADASDFIDLSSKSNPGRHYVRVDKRSDKKTGKGGEAMR